MSDATHPHPQQAPTPIAIIGVSSLFPNASDPKAYWELIRCGKDAIGDVPETHWSAEDYLDPDPKKPDHTYCARGGFLSPVSFDPTEFGIPPNALEATDTSQLLSLVAAKRLMRDAGYADESRYDKQRVGVILGVTGTQELVISLGARLGHPIWKRALDNAGLPEAQRSQILEDISDGYVDWQENSFPGLLGNVVAGRIASRLDFGGTNCVVDAACASSLSAMHLSMLELSSGRADMMITGGVDTLNDIFMYMCFSKTPALSPTGDARPFSSDADGTVLGEGIGMVLLKRLDDAKRDGDNIYAIIRSMGTSSDGKSRSIYAPRSEGQQRTLKRAYREAGISPRDLDLVEAHGTGTKVGDATEFSALDAVFSEASEEQNWCALGSVKAQIGHTKAAAGAASVIKAALALHHKILPPTIKIAAPNPKMGIEESPFYLNTKARPWAKKDKPRRAGVSSFGFGGSNFHVVLEEATEDKRTTDWAGAPLFFAASGETQSAISDQLKAWQTEQSGDRDDLLRLAANSRASFSHEPAHRIAIVAKDAAELPSLINKALQHLSVAKAEALSTGSISYGGPTTSADRGQLAVLFPGQGSQYPYMMQDILCAFPEGFSTLEHANAAFEGDGQNNTALLDLLYPPNTFAQDEKQAHKHALANTAVAQPALGAANLGTWRILQSFGLEAQMMAGHSYGELAALCAAGRVSEEDFHRMSNRRGQLMAQGNDDRGTMLAVSAPLEDIDAFLDAHQLDVVLANRNTPKQGVLSGTQEAIDAAEELCKLKGWRCTKLTVSAAFHSKLVEDARAPFAAFLKELDWQPANTPVFANTTASPYPAEADKARETLAQQLTSPVKFVEQIKAMYEAGARTFVEVGPKTVLTGLTRSILEGQPHHTVSLDASRGRKFGLRDLAGCLAQLAALGYPLALEQWHPAPAEPPKQRMSIPLVGANYRSTKRKQRERVRPKTNGTHAGSQPTPQPKAPTATSVTAQGVPSTQQPQTPIATHVFQKPMATQPMVAGAPRYGQSTMTQQYSNGNGQALPANAIQGNGQQTAGQSALVPHSAQGTHPALFQHALQLVQDGIRSMQALQQETAASHRIFLDGQQQAQYALRDLLHQSQRLLDAGLFGQPLSAPVAAAPAPLYSPAPAPMPAPVVPAPSWTPQPPQAPAWFTQVPQAIQQPVSMTPVAPSAPVATQSLAPVAPAPVAPAPVAPAVVQPVSTPVATPAPTAETSSVTVDGLTNTMLDVVSELTGYPQEMLSLEMDMEADLGIDSIKRVEILSAVTERMPQLASEHTDHLGSMRTLQQIVDALFEEQAASNGAGAAPSPFDQTQTAITPAVLSGPSASADAVERRKLVLQPTSQPNTRRLALGEKASFWLTDQGPLSRSLADALAQRGYQTTMTPALDASEDEWQAFLAGAQKAPITGLIAIAPDAEVALTWHPAEERTLTNAFRLVQHATPGLLANPEESICCTITKMDGGFGLRQPAGMTPVQGGLAGLVKTLARENPTLHCRAIDVAPALASTPETIAETLALHCTHDGPIEVGLTPDGPMVLALRKDAPATGTNPLQKDDVVIVTGGARGVTAAVAEALAAKHQPNLFLWGRSPLPGDEPQWLAQCQSDAEIKKGLLTHHFTQRPTPKELEWEFQKVAKNREIKQTLASIEATGASATYMAVDVRNRADVNKAVNTIRESSGKGISMLIHAAGVIEDKRITEKSLASFDKVFGTKVEGLRHLLHATADDPLHSIVFFSSVSGRTGNVGQVDYAMANEVLNKVARQHAAKREGCRVLSLNWGPWDGGMVTPALKRMFEAKGVSLIGLGDGARAMLATMEDHAIDDVEIILGSVFEEPTKPTPAVVPSTPAMEQVLEMQLSVKELPILDAHQIGGRPVVPLALSLEWLAHGARHGHPGLDLIGFSKVRVTKGIKLDTADTKVQLWAGESKQHGNAYLAPLALRDGNASNGQSLLVKGDAILSIQRPTPAPLSLPENLAATAYPRSIGECYRDILFHGEALHGIKTITGHSKAGMTARLQAAPRPKTWLTLPLRRKWSFDPLVLDSAFQMAILWCDAHFGMRSLPSFIGELIQYKKFPQQEQMLTCHFVVKSTSPHKVVADIHFVEESEGGLLASITGYECTMDASLAAAFHQSPSSAQARRPRG